MRIVKAGIYQSQLLAGVFDPHQFGSNGSKIIIVFQLPVNVLTSNPHPLVLPAAYSLYVLAEPLLFLPVVRLLPDLRRGSGAVAEKPRLSRWRPIMAASAPVKSMTYFTFLTLSISPLAITGIFTDCLTARMV